MADKRISQLVERTDIANNDVVPIVASGATTTNKATISSIQEFMQENLDLGVSSVGITLGTIGNDVSVSGSPITTSGNITINIPSASSTARGLVNTISQTFSGEKTFANGLSLLPAGGTNQVTRFLNIGFVHQGSDGSNQIGFNVSNNIYFGKGLDNGGIISWDNSAVRTYTLPDASGTVALASQLDGYVTLGTAQTITAQKVFTTSGSSDTMIISHGSGSGFALDVIKAGNGEAIRVQKTSGSGNAMTISGGNFEAPAIVKTGGTATQFLKANGSVDSNTYLTTASASAVYVPYTGANANLDLGQFDLFADSIRVNGSNGTGSYLGFKHATTATTGAEGYTSMYTFGTNTIGFKSVSGATNKDFLFDMSGITANVVGGRVYTLPDASGTLALTSNLGAYLPLTGGTLTGALNGTSASFTGGVNLATTSGNVGIGTANPLYRLDVLEAGATTAANAFSMARITGSDSVANDLTLIGPNTSQVRIKFGDPEDATIGEIGYNHSNNSLRLNTNGGTRLTIDSTGNVGIGISSPTAKLHIQELTSNIEYAVFSNSSVASRALSFSSFISGGTNSTGHLINALSSLGALAFGVNGERMRITSDGNVGIGTASPAFKLDVQTSSGENYIRVSSAANQDGGFRIAEGTTNKWLLYNIAASDAFAIYDNTATAERMRITSTGNVGIGTSTPNASSRLDITSTTQGFLPPRMTSTQKTTIATPATGLVVYDTTLNKLAVYTGAAWETVTSL